MLIIYNSLLLILYACSCFVAGCLFLKHREKHSSYIMFLYICLLISEMVTFTAEFVPGFSGVYGAAYRTIPIFNTFISITVSVCLLSIYSDWTGDLRIKRREYIILLCLCLFLLYLPGKDISSFRLFLYSSAPLFYLFYRMLLFVSFFYKKKSEAVHGLPGVLRSFFYPCMIGFPLAGIIENQIRIFIKHTDSHSFRNFSYDLLFAYCAVCYMVLYLKKETAPHVSEADTPVQNSQEKKLSGDLTPAEKAGIFYRFCETFSLTLREQEVFAEFLRQADDDTISQSLMISSVTVKTHVYHILRKTGTSSRQELFVLYEGFLHSSLF